MSDKVCCCGWKKNLYILREAWNAASKEDKFRLANLGQSPSYISLMSALEYYEITTQMQRDFFESVAVKRTKEIQVNDNVFRYSKINVALYFGFKIIEARRRRDFGGEALFQCPAVNRVKNGVDSIFFKKKMPS